MPDASGRAAETHVFLFSDLRGYTDYVERHGDAAAAELLAAYREIVRASVAGHNGAEIKTEGDSFYVVFDSPSAAIACAIAIQRAVHAHRAARPEHDLHVGIGMHAGETVPFQGQYVGSAVNLASRLAGQADPDEVLVSDTLRGLVRTSLPLPLTDRGPLSLKGVSERIRTWRLEWRDGGAEPSWPVGASLLRRNAPSTLPRPQGDLVCPALVGRSAELDRVRLLVDAVVAGRGQSLVIGGEAGVGKTAFVRETLDEVLSRDGRALYGATTESDHGVPYAALTSAIRSGFRGADREGLAGVIRAAGRALAPLFPELGSVDPRDAPARVEQHRIALAFGDLFAAFAREAPLAVVLEDLHWADDATLDVVHHLTRELRDVPVFLVTTYRNDELHRRHPFLRLLSGLQRERLVAEITLQRLTPEVLGDLIGRTLRLTSPVPTELRDVVYARSEGNPFFTEELLKALVDQGDLVKSASGWDRRPIAALRIPGSVRETIRERLDRLSPTAQDSLSAAAVIGQRFTFDLLREVLDTDERRLVADLKEHVDRQLVVEAIGTGTYGFRHALTREVVYDELLVPERKKLHRVIATILAREAGTEPAVLAAHLVAAGDPSAAVPHLLRAAEQALKTYAPRDAAAHLERALSIGVAPEAQASVMERLTDALFLADPERAVKAGEAAAEAYLARGDRHGASRALAAACRSQSFMMRTEGDLRLALTLGDRALQALDGLPESRELAWAQAIKALITDNKPEAERLARAAIAIGERVGDDRSLAHASVTLGLQITWDDPTAARAALDRGLQVALAGGMSDIVWRAYSALPNLLLAAGAPITNQTAAVGEAIAYAQRHGLSRSRYHVMSLVRDHWAGEWDSVSSERSSVSETVRWHVAVGRDGPEAARPLLDAARDSVADDDLYRLFVYGSLLGGYARLRDRHEAEVLMRKLETGLTEKPFGEYFTFTTWAIADIAVGVLFLDRPEWIDRMARIVRPDTSPFLESILAFYDAARAIGTNDVIAAAGPLARYTELQLVICPGFCVMATVDLGREAERRGLELAPLAASLRSVRPVAERAKATWLRSEIDRLSEAGPS